MTSGGGHITPDAHSARFFGFFAWYVARMFRSQFHAVRMLRGGDALLASLEREPGPAIVALTHASWWDPLVCVHLHQTFSPTRVTLGPIDAAELAKFKFMRKIGLFGVDPHDPAALEPMVEHVAMRVRQTPRTTFWITPQGRFVDVREPVTIRPGVSAVASRLCAQGPCRVIALAIEIGMWVDKKPEVFLCAQECRAETAGSTASWHRAITRGMRGAAATLAEAVIARDPSPFVCIEGGDAPRIHPVYDAILSLRGKRTKLGQQRESAATSATAERVS